MLTELDCAQLKQQLVELKQQCRLKAKGAWGRHAYALMKTGTGNTMSNLFQGRQQFAICSFADGRGEEEDRENENDICCFFRELLRNGETEYWQMKTCNCFTLLLMTMMKCALPAMFCVSLSLWRALMRGGANWYTPSNTHICTMTLDWSKHSRMPVMYVGFVRWTHGRPGGSGGSHSHCRGFTLVLN